MRLWTCGPDGEDGNAVGFVNRRRSLIYKKHLPLLEPGLQSITLYKSIGHHKIILY